jgi:hypothetical protein
MTAREQEIDLRLIDVLTSAAAFSTDAAVPLTPDSLLEAQCLAGLVRSGVIREAGDRRFYFDRGSLKVLERRERGRAFRTSLLAMVAAFVIISTALFLLYRYGS